MERSARSSMGLAAGGAVLVLAMTSGIARAQVAAQAVPVPGYGAEHYARNFGIYYRLEPYHGSFGARLTRYPTGGSAAASIGLEPGDLITSADGMGFFGPADVENHWWQTPISFVNIRTGYLQTANLYMPGGPGGAWYPPAQTYYPPSYPGGNVDVQAGPGGIFVGHGEPSIIDVP